MQDVNQEQNGFNYTYSAKEQAEIKSIRDKYAPASDSEDKMTRLRRLDASVTNTASAVALIFGVLGTLMLGFGMSLIMTDFGKILGAFENMSMPLGIGIGVVGGIVASLAYPIYNAMVRAKRKKIAPEIIRLSDELMK